MKGNLPECLQNGNYQTLALWNDTDDVKKNKTSSFPSIFFTQATVLEEMPPFPERESSILAKLKKKKKEKAGILDKEEKAEPPEKPTANGQIPVANEVKYLLGIFLLPGHNNIFDV